VVDSTGRNVVDFIRAIRDAAGTWNDLEVYALMVLDFALVQLGGLAFGSSGNQISDPRSAVYLLAAVADWYVRISKRAHSNLMREVYGTFSGRNTFTR